MTNGKVPAKRILLISLYPLKDTGGGERYTYETIRSIGVSGDICDAYALTSTIGDHRHSLSVRLAASFSKVVAQNIFLRERPAAPLYRILDQVSNYDVIWVEQFLSNDTVFDIIASVASDQYLLFTNLGHEPLSYEFAACYQPAASHWFIEISGFSARRSLRFSANTVGISAAAWRADLREFSSKSYNFKNRLVSIGRVLPHKGFEHAIRALPADCSLAVVGPYFQDDRYVSYLRECSGGRHVDFLGEVSEEAKREAIYDSDLLVASSCHRLYDGRVIEQAELLGIIMFEALAEGTLPIASSVPSFLEVMSNLGLSDFVYQEGDADDLQKAVARYRGLANQAIRERIIEARAKVEEQYLWDDFWWRVKARVGV